MSADVENNILLLKPFTPKLIEPQTENLHSCAICESTALYKCPKCLIRTCSAKCSKTHKEKNNCDGQRPRSNILLDGKQKWKKIQGYSNFKEDTSIEDQQFLHQIKQRKNNSDETECLPKTEKIENTSLNTQNLNDNQKPKLSYNDQSLLKSAQFRRIWLLPSNDLKDFGSSRIEQFSDTIFWKCTVKFAYRAPVEETEEMNESSIKNEESFQEDETFDDEACSSVITHSAKPLVDYEVEDGEELKISDNIVDVKEKIEKEEGEIETELKTEEKQFSDNDANVQHDDEKIIEDINSYQEPLLPLKWLSYTVQNIPESIRVSTLLRQFLRPKPYGTVISKSELDMDFLQQFTTASKSIIDPANDLDKECVRDQLTVYSEVALPLGKEEDEVTSKNDCQSEAELRYYPVNPQQTILENLRNRYVVGHPCFVVLLRRENEFGEFEFPMVGEVEQALLNAERERTVVVKDRPRWQNRNRNSDGRGFRNGGQFQHNSRQHKNGVKKGGGRQRMSEHYAPPRPPNGQWQQQGSYGPIYNTPPFNQYQYHFHPYMPATFMPQMAQPGGQGNDQRGGFSQ
uniref:HIT-type domain-containing protein n=2 Tax=Meloidogyne TaxID=189290 RepID=A0A915P344_9BILA